MSFVVTVYIPTAIVMSSDSRQSVTIERHDQKTKSSHTVETTGSDFVYKTILLEQQQVGINCFGSPLLGKQTVESHIKRFSEEVVQPEDTVATIPRKLIDFLRDGFPNADTAFHVAGFRTEGRRRVAYVFHCHVGRNEVTRKNVKPNSDDVVYGASWGGQHDIISALLEPSKKAGAPPILWDAMTVQDAIDFAIFATRTTIDTMRFQARPKTVGGPIDVLLLTPDEPPHWIQRKEYHGAVSKV